MYSAHFLYEVGTASIIFTDQLYDYNRMPNIVYAPLPKPLPATKQL